MNVKRTYGAWAVRGPHPSLGFYGTWAWDDTEDHAIEAKLFRTRIEARASLAAHKEHFPDYWEGARIVHVNVTVEEEP